MPASLAAWLVLLPLAVPEAAEVQALTFDEALGLSARAPRVTGAEGAAATKREIDRKISSFTGNPQLLLEPGVRLFPDEERGSIEGQIRLLQPWSLSRLAGARRRAASAEEAVLSAEARAIALTQRLGVARGWIDLWSSQRVLEAAQREEELAAQLVSLTERMTRVEETTRADLAEARAYGSEAKLQRIAVEGEVFERGIELARVSAHPSRRVAVKGPLPEPPLPPSGDAPRWIDRASRLPDVIRRELDTRAERAREVEQRALHGGTLLAGVAIFKDRPDGYVLLGSLTFTPPIFDRGERDRASLLAGAAKLDGERAAAAVEAAADLALAFHEVEHTAETVGELDRGLVPAVRAQLEMRERIFRARETTLVEVIRARRAALSAVSRLERARAAHAWARVKVWLLLAAIAPASEPTSGDLPAAGGPAVESGRR